MSTKKKIARRLKLWRRQHGQCYYCGRLTREVNQDGGKLPDDASTLEHLRDKYDATRNNNDGHEHTVMACAKCNTERGLLRQRDKNV